MPTPPIIDYKDMCNDEDVDEGIVYNKYKIIEDKTMKKATGAIVRNIKKFIKNRRRRASGNKIVHNIYFGKTNINGEHIKLDKPKTWGKKGINRAYKAPYMLVLAVVDNECIPEKCMEDKYITHSEEYAITLRTRLIEYFRDKKHYSHLMASTDLTGGRRSENRKGYVVYMTFSLKGKYDLTLGGG